MPKPTKKKKKKKEKERKKYCKIFDFEQENSWVIYI